jgi:S-disulfanyl-L-cysteine oxidoreductase SoxD
MAQTQPAPTNLGIGHAATPAQIQSWNIDIGPDGANLPAGSGSVAQGKQVYVAQCAACHGPLGQGGLGDRLVGGQGTLATTTPVKTVGSYWPYATTLYDYIRRAMPLNAPQSLSNADVYAVSGYVLFLNGLVDERAVIDATTLTNLKMPNRDGFVGDGRPDVRNPGCTKDCAE